MPEGPIYLFDFQDFEDENRWDTSFARSQELLQRLGQQALADYQAGNTEPLDSDTL